MNLGCPYTRFALTAAVGAFTALPGLLPAQGQGYSNRFTSVTAGLAAYAQANGGNFPPDKNPGDTTSSFYLPDTLTTPISYLQPQQVIDPFAAGVKYNRFGYFNTESFKQTSSYQQVLARHGKWAMWSVGPSRIEPYYNPPKDVTNPIRYDASNGVLSTGVIFRSERMQTETGTY